LHQKYITEQFMRLGVQLPDHLFLSYEQGCEYQEISHPNLIDKLFASLSLMATDQVVLALGSKERDARDFAQVANQRNLITERTAIKNFPGTCVILWENTKIAPSGKPNSLLEQLDSCGVLNAVRPSAKL
jgi:hypothetical protein